MERRKFLRSLCVAGAAAVSVGSVTGSPAPRKLRLCRVVNGTDRTIYLKIVGAMPELCSHPDRGGILFPEEEYFDNLGEGKRVVIAWDHTGEKVLTLKEVNVLTPCVIDVREGDVFVSHEL
jgi:hypothetical protein